MINQRLISNSI